MGCHEVSWLQATQWQSGATGCVAAGSFAIPTPPSALPKFGIPSRRSINCSYVSCMGAIGTLTTSWQNVLENVLEYAKMDTNRPLLHSEALQEHTPGCGKLP